MPDDVFGEPVPEPGRPRRKRQLADHHQRTTAQRVQDCLDYPLLYEMAELLPAPHVAGCPRAYPSVVYPLMAALTPVTKSKRSTAGLLASPGQWCSLRAAVRRHMGRRAAMALPAAAPTRGQYDYAVNKLLVPAADLLEEEFRRYAALQALEQRLFPAAVPKVWNRRQRRQLLVGDATVPKAPSKARRGGNRSILSPASCGPTALIPPPVITTRTARRPNGRYVGRSGSSRQDAVTATGPASS